MAKGRRQHAGWSAVRGSLVKKPSLNQFRAQMRTEVTAFLASRGPEDIRCKVGSSPDNRCDRYRCRRRFVAIGLFIQLSLADADTSEEKLIAVDTNPGGGLVAESRVLRGDKSRIHRSSLRF